MNRKPFWLRISRGLLLVVATLGWVGAARGTPAEDGEATSVEAFVRALGLKTRLAENSRGQLIVVDEHCRGVHELDAAWDRRDLPMGQARTQAEAWQQQINTWLNDPQNPSREQILLASEIPSLVLLRHGGEVALRLGHHSPEFNRNYGGQAHLLASVPRATNGGYSGFGPVSPYGLLGIPREGASPDALARLSAATRQRVIAATRAHLLAAARSVVPTLGDDDGALQEAMRMQREGEIPAGFEAASQRILKPLFFGGAIPQAAEALMVMRAAPGANHYDYRDERVELPVPSGAKVQGTVAVSPIWGGTVFFGDAPVTWGHPTLGARFREQGWSLRQVLEAGQLLVEQAQAMLGARVKESRELQQRIARAAGAEAPPPLSMPEALNAAIPKEVRADPRRWVEALVAAAGQLHPTLSALSSAGIQSEQLADKALQKINAWLNDRGNNPYHAQLVAASEIPHAMLDVRDSGGLVLMHHALDGVRLGLTTGAGATVADAHHLAALVPHLATTELQERIVRASRKHLLAAARKVRPDLGDSDADVHAAIRLQRRGAIPRGEQKALERLLVPLLLHRHSPLRAIMKQQVGQGQAVAEVTLPIPAGAAINGPAPVLRFDPAHRTAGTVVHGPEMRQLYPVKDWVSVQLGGKDHVWWGSRYALPTLGDAFAQAGWRARDVAASVRQLLAAHPRAGRPRPVPGAAAK